MMPRPDFFRKNFTMVRKLYCEKCKVITQHNVQVIVDSPDDGVVPCLRVCLDCFTAYKKLDAIGIEVKTPVTYQRFFVQSYVFLVLHSHYLD